MDAVKRWLIDSGISHDATVVPKSRGSVHFSTTIGRLEDILQIKYHVYHRPRSVEDHIGTDQYSLPQDVSEVVDFIVPGLATMRKRTENGAQNKLARRRVPQASARASNSSFWSNPDGKPIEYTRIPICSEY